ncbi:MAG TPA: hypothetical protein VKZ59_01095 [Acidobacteriota bacterium]|nr:hypothetical protein [Acidobacteriota bacterium]
MKKVAFFRLIPFFVVVLAVSSLLFAGDRARAQRQPGIAIGAPAFAEGQPAKGVSALEGSTLRKERLAHSGSKTRVFPWLALSGDYVKELRIDNAAEGLNRSRLMVLSSRELATWDIGFSKHTVSSPIPRDTSAIAMRSLRPSNVFVLWKRWDRVEWADPGEEGPPVDLPPSNSIFLLEFQGEGIVALQFEVDGTAFEVFRSAQLRPSVSFLSRHDVEAQRTRVALVATDLQPLDPQFALLATENSEALPEVLNVIASDAEGNSVPVQVDFTLITLD